MSSLKAVLEAKLSKKFRIIESQKINDRADKRIGFILGVKDSYYYLEISRCMTARFNVLWISNFFRFKESKEDLGHEILRELMEINFEIFGTRCIEGSDSKNLLRYTKNFKHCNNDYEYPRLCVK